MLALKSRPIGRPVVRHALLIIALLTCSVVGVAQEPQQPPHPEDKPSPLCRAVSQTSVDLADIIGRCGVGYRVVLRAGFALDPEGRLSLTALMSSSPAPAEKAGRPPTPEALRQAGFEEWTGPVFDGCWLPRRRVVREKVTLLAAERMRTDLAAGKTSLWTGAKAAHGVRNSGDRPSQRVLTIEPAHRRGLATFRSIVAVDGNVHRLEQTRAGRALLAFKQAPEPARTAAEVPTFELPAFPSEGVSWIGAEKPVTLKSLRGRATLVLVTDPG